jgi:tellurite resistance protein TehA-like permease
MVRPEPARRGFLAELHPAYFALVMATGIVSIASHLVGFQWLSRALLALNLVFYPSVWTLTLLRLVRHRQHVIADLLHHGRSVGFFTTVAATSMLGSQLFVVANAPRAAAAFWALGVLLWTALTYAVFTILMVKSEKPPLSEGIHGGWLVGVVAAQSIAVLGAQLAPTFAPYQAQTLFFCLAMWLGGSMLYFWIISLIFYRYTFFVLEPSDLAPPYWINMGAAAITALAGAVLVGAAPHSPVLQQLLPFVRGFTLFWWATATWWIPMLVILAIWRHVYRKFPLRYDPLYWGAVFPLGMYTVSTFRLSRALDAPYLEQIPRLFIYAALLAWGSTLFGMVRSLRVHAATASAGGR